MNPPATTYGTELARNLRAARTRADLSPQDLAERMRHLGHTQWHAGTAGMIERGERRITADEILCVALALDTTLRALLSIACTRRQITLAGHTLTAADIRHHLDGTNDQPIHWDGNVPGAGPANST